MIRKAKLLALLLALPLIFFISVYGNSKITGEDSSYEVVKLNKISEFSQKKVKKEYRLSRINSFDISCLGYLYAIGTKEGIIQMFRVDNGKYLKSIKINRKGTSLPMVVRRDGHVFVADVGSARIFEYDYNLTMLDTIYISLPNMFVDLAMDYEGNFFICYFDNDSMIHKYSKKGKYICSFGSTPEMKKYFSVSDKFYERYIRKNASIGFISLDDSGNVYYTHQNPYDIRQYRNDGLLIKRITRNTDFFKPLNEYIKILPRERVLFIARGGSCSILASIKHGLIINCVARPVFDEDEISVNYWDSAIDFFDLDGEWKSSLVFKKTNIFDIKEDKYGNIYILEIKDKPIITKYLLTLTN